MGFHLVFGNISTVSTRNHKFLKYRNAYIPANVKSYNRIISTQSELQKWNVSQFGYTLPNHGMGIFVQILSHFVYAFL